MAHFEKETIQKHRVFYHPKGTKIFVYANTFGGLENIIGQTTHLCTVEDVIFVNKDCYCGGTTIQVNYMVRILDSMDEFKIGLTFEINPENSNASRYQSRATYHGSWHINKEEQIDSLSLIKKVKNPSYYELVETVDLLHISYPGAFESRIISKEQIGEMAVHKLKVNLTYITDIDYCTIKTDSEGYKVKGYKFEFLDSSLNFTVTC